MIGNMQFQSQAPLVSIIMLTLNELDHTVKCLASIEAHTSQPHELIIVDNGSTDGTVEFLRRYVAEQDHVRVVANASNRGFAAPRWSSPLAGGESLCDALAVKVSYVACGILLRLCLNQLFPIL